MLTLNDYLRDSDERPLGPSKDGRWFLFEWNDGLMTHKRRKWLYSVYSPQGEVIASWINHKGLLFHTFSRHLSGIVQYDWREHYDNN